MGRLGTESAFEVLARAKALEAAGRPVIHLEIGEPDFPTAPHIIQAAVEAGRSAVTGEWRNCHCQCTAAHPADTGVCDGRAVMTRKVSGSDVSLCAPCAVAQGVAEMKL